MKAVTNKHVPDNVCSEDIDNNEILCKELARTEAGLKKSMELIIGEDKCEANLDGTLLRKFPDENIFIHKEGPFYYCFTLSELKGILKTAREHDPEPIELINPYTRQPLNEGEIQEWINQREDLFDEAVVPIVEESIDASYYRRFNELFKDVYETARPT